MMSKLTTGYSYAVEFDEDKMFTMIDAKTNSRK